MEEAWATSSDRNLSKMRVLALGGWNRGVRVGMRAVEMMKAGLRRSAYNNGSEDVHALLGTYGTS